MVMFKRNRLACAVAVAASMSGLAHAQDAIELQPTTVVSASGFEQNIKDAPATISVITAEELKKRSYTDITDALKNVAGVQIAGGGVEQSIMVRGMTSAYTLFLIDGRPAQGNDAFSERGSQQGTPINFLPPLESIERIEVIRGPASALYGSDAMGGVINIITKKVSNELSGSVTTEYTVPSKSNELNEDTWQTSAYLNVPLIEDVLGLQLTGAYHDQDESNFVGGSDAAATDPKYEKRNAGGKLSWNINEQNNLTLGHSYTKQERWKNPGRSLLETDDPTYNESIKKNYFIEHEGNYDSLLLKSYVNYDHSENATTLNPETGKGIEYEVITANTQATYFIGSHAITGGLTHKYENLEHNSNGLREPVVPDANATVEMNRYQNSIFLEDNWNVTDSFILTLSGRLDDNQAFGSQFSPKVYGVYHLNDNFTVKGGVTTGYKAPDLRSSATDFGSTSMGGVIIGNPDLTPETSVNREIGIAYEEQDLGLLTTLTAYVIDYEDKINRTGRVCPQDPTESVPCVYNGTTYPGHRFGYTAYENVDEAELRGIEWTLDYRLLDNLTYRHSYTYTETEQKSGDFKGKPLNDIAKHMFNASLDWQATDRINVWTQYNYRGKTSGRWQTGTSGSNTNGFRYPAYSFVDAGVAFKATNNLTLKAGVYNLGNKEVTTDGEYAYNLDGRRFIFSLTQAF